MTRINIFTNKLFLIALTVIIALYTLGMNKNENNQDGKIFKNIYIKEIPIGHLTIYEAKKEVEKHYKPKDIQIRYKDKKWYIKESDINLDYNVDRALKKAYNYNRTEDKVENIKRMFNLSFNERYSIDLHASYDESKLSSIIEQISKEINVDVVQANIEIKESGEIKRTNSKEGIEVDIVKLKENIYKMIDKKNINEINLPTNIIKPKINTEDVDSINTVLGQYSTSFNDKTSRGSNIYVAAKSTGDTLIMPGETFSYNKSTGARTWSNGYKSAKVIVGGKYVNGEGGGVCQVSTTIYNAALLAAMEIEEVHNHTFSSHYAPRGKDAAVSYGYTDFKFRNPYSHPIYIKNIVNNGAITSKIYGCSQDREKLYIKTEEKHVKDKINVKTYRIYLGEENNKIREELISNSEYKIK